MADFETIERKFRFRIILDRIRAWETEPAEQPTLTAAQTSLIQPYIPQLHWNNEGRIA